MMIIIIMSFENTGLQEEEEDGDEWLMLLWLRKIITSAVQAENCNIWEKWSKNGFNNYVMWRPIHTPAANMPYIEAGPFQTCDAQSCRQFWGHGVAQADELWRSDGIWASVSKCANSDYLLGSCCCHILFGKYEMCCLSERIEPHTCMSVSAVLRTCCLQT